MSKKLKACKACGNQISKKATQCPQCGEKIQSSANAVATLIVMAGIFWFFFVFQGLEKSVANDFVTQYNLAVKSGDKMEICVHAGFVAAGYNQAHDEKNYLRWKAIEKRDCARAGIKK